MNAIHTDTTTPAATWHPRHAERRQMRRAAQARRSAIRTEIAMRQLTLLR